MSTTNSAKWAGAMILLVSGGCYAANGPDDSADTNTSWLQSCEQSSDCGSGFSCVGGLCEVDDSPSTEPAAEATSAGSARAVTLEADEPFLLSAPERTVEPPTLRWVDDHWVAAWQSWSTDGSVSPASGYLGPWNEVTRIAADGSVGAAVLSESPAAWVPDLILTDAGRLGVLHNHAACRLEVFEPDYVTMSSTLDIPCGADSNSAAATPIAGSEDWLVAYGAGHQGGEYVLGRYQPASGGWSVEPFALGPRAEYDALDVFVSDDHALVAWGNPTGSSLATVPSMGAAQGAAAPPAGTIHPVAMSVIGSDTHFALARPASGGPLVFGVDEDVLWSTRVALGGEPVISARTVAVAGIADVRPVAAFIDTLDLTAVCYGTGTGPASGAGDRRDGVAMVLVDSEGIAVGEPRVIAEGIDNMHGCALAWSGEALLVIWLDIEMGPDPAPSTLVRGQIFRPR